MSSVHMLALLVLTLGATAPMTAQQLLARYQQDAITTQRLADTNGDGKQELVLVQFANGAPTADLLRMALGATNGDGITAELIERGRIALTDPTHTLIAIADLLSTAGDEVIVANARGIHSFAWQLSGASEPAARTVLVRRARFRLRVDRPQISPFVMDLNQDGRLDLMLPSMRGVQPYLQEAVDEAGVPQFRRMDVVPVPVAVTVDPGSTGLDPELTGSLRIPQIKTEDLNGDDRPDLLTQEGQVRKFHLQGEDGTFLTPIVVDLDQFEDSTPKAAMDFGTTAVIGDRQLLQRGDINGDGIPDYVIAHRRKIWTFLADQNGPQFRKARTQAVADDVTAMLVVDIDEDKRADLLTFRVQLPGIGTILLGLVRSIDIDIKAVGYASEADGFARRPKWRRTVTLRIPPILSLLSQQEELVDRFTGLLEKTRISARGQFRGGDEKDVAVVTQDNKTIELLVDVGEAPELTTKEGQRMLRKLLFEDDNTIFDIDRVFALVSGFLDQLSARTVGDNQAVASLPLRDPDIWQLVDLMVGDLDDAAGDELIAVYRARMMKTRRAYDVLSWR